MEESPELINLLGTIEMLQIDEQDEHERDLLKKKELQALLFNKLDLNTPTDLRSEIRNQLIALEGLPSQCRMLMLRSLV